MTREDREIWDDLDDDERMEAYAGVIDERNAVRRPVAAAYDRFKHLDRVFEMVGAPDGTENTDPFHAAARDLWRAVKASLGIPAKRRSMKPLVGEFNIPLTWRELLFQLSNGVPVQIGRAFLSKALLLVERCASAEIDVQTNGGDAYLTPRRCDLNDEGKAYIANDGREPARR